MMQEQKINYQKELEKVIESNVKAGLVGDKAPSLLMHACCAPCSSYCMEYLCIYFKITIYYYNPNISLSEEYTKRVEEEKRLITTYNKEIESGTREGLLINIIEGPYEPECFYEAVKGYEHLGENSERCFRCFAQRLEKSAGIAAEGGFDYMTTTLTISPLKNAAKLNEIGKEKSKAADVNWLPSDFKKKNGYKRSIELSTQYSLYRQDYCGCAYSKAERINS